MTKLRAPLSVEQALARIAGQLPEGFEQMARETGRSASLVRKWGDPEREEQITLEHAVKLDLAYKAAGGEGYPLFDAYANRLELAEAAAFADRFTLLRHAHKAIKEGGEAHAAMIAASLPDASPADRRAAHREVAEALEAMKPALVAFGEPSAAPP